MVPRPSADALARHPHLAAPLPDGWVRVDLHSHTMWSGDSTTTPDEIERAVVESGLDVLCITDHNAVKGAQQLASSLSCRVIVGEEMKTHAGELIGLFLTERVPMGIPPAEAARAIRAQGGVVYVPHPFDPMRRPMQRDALEEAIAEGWIDAIEGFNALPEKGKIRRPSVIIVARGIWQGGSESGASGSGVMAYGLHVGTRLPAHATSTGQVLLANLPPTQLKTWLQAHPLTRLTPQTATSAKALKQKLKRVAEQDYCLADQEHELGVDALAAPLRDMRGDTVAALNLVRTGAGADEINLATRWLPLLQQTAQELRALI